MSDIDEKKIDNKIPEHPSTNGWGQWGKHVLAELERQNQCILELGKTIQKLQIENAILKVKSGVWGAIGALIPIVIGIIIWIVRSIILSGGM